MTTAGDDRARLEAETTSQVTSPDGLVRATIDAEGSLVKLEFQPNTFERTTPTQLANTVQTVVRQGSLQVKQKIADLTEGVPPLPPMPAPKPATKRVRPSRVDQT